MTAYDTGFLERNGYLGRAGTDTAHVDGDEVSFVFDPEARLAYFESVDPDRQQTVVSELRTFGRNLDFYWFWNPDDERVAVYNRYGEHKWFVYNRSVCPSADARRKKARQLESIDDGLGTLFDVRAVVDRFYRQLWDIRLDIARSFDVPNDAEIGDGERLTAAQRTIDRLIFCYFLAKKDVIHGIDATGNRFGLTPEKLFETVLDNGDFHSFLTETFFEHLNREGWMEHRVTDAVSITYPYLNGGLFRDHEIPTADGGSIAESELDAGSYDWTALIKALNGYDWVIDESPSDEAEGGTSEKLTPAVLGHIFEKFVITVRELSEEDELTLDDLEEMEVSASGEQLLEGNRRVGAYYTPNYVAYENTRETLWNRVRTVLVDEHGVDPEAAASPDAFFERVHADRDSASPAVELADVEAVLEELTVLDPAAGSGAFLVTAGDILETWRCRCSDETSRFEIRRDIVKRSLYGVDLLDGAVEVCKLRLWLWLLGATTVDLSQDVPLIEPLPNVDCNVRQGNSLVGVARSGDDSLLADVEFEWTDGVQTTYPEAVAGYRETFREYRGTSGAEATQLRESIATQRELLRRKFDEILAGESDVRVEEEVQSREAFTRAIDGVARAVKCNLEFDSPMTDAERRQVSEAGFREQANWETTAYHADVREAAPEAVRSVFDLMDGRGTVSIERPIGRSDVENVDPFHWIFEFPTAYDPTGDDAVAFDAVIGNPPHGSSLSEPQTSLLAEEYALVEGGPEAAKLFVERSWTLTDGELSYVVPKASTYNSNWEDFRKFCLPKMHRGVDLGKAFGNVDHEQVTIHLSDASNGGAYTCGRLPDGAYHLDDSAEIDRSFAEHLGTLPVSFSSEQQSVAKGLGNADLPTLGDHGVDAGRGASTTNRVGDPDAPVAFNGKQVQRYVTRAATARVDVDELSNAASERLESPKVMAQNIIAHVQNPYDHLVIAAAYDPTSSYNFETVTNVSLPEESLLSLPSLAVLLNTQFVNWFVYVSIFNRAIRDMHLDRYFLERVVLPKHVSETHRTLLDRLYGLLAIAGVATEYDALPDGRAVYRELQSVANALTYDLYLSDVDDQSLETDLAESIAGVLDEYEIDYEDWYAAHLRSSDDEDIVSTFAEHRALYGTAERVADALDCETVGADLEAIADHPWVDVIERGRHKRDGDARPVFGPNDA